MLMERGHNDENNTNTTFCVSQGKTVCLFFLSQIWSEGYTWLSCIPGWSELKVWPHQYIYRLYTGWVRCHKSWLLLPEVFYTSQVIVWDFLQEQKYNYNHPGRDRIWKWSIHKRDRKLGNEFPRYFWSKQIYTLPHCPSKTKKGANLHVLISNPQKTQCARKNLSSRLHP